MTQNRISLDTVDKKCVDLSLSELTEPKTGPVSNKHYEYKGSTMTVVVREFSEIIPFTNW